MKVEPAEVMVEAEVMLVACWSEVEAVLAVCLSKVTEVKVEAVLAVCLLEVMEATGVELGRGGSVTAPVGVAVAERKASGDRRGGRATVFSCSTFREDCFLGAGGTDPPRWNLPTDMVRMLISEGCSVSCVSG